MDHRASEFAAARLQIRRYKRAAHALCRRARRPYHLISPNNSFQNGPTEIETHACTEHKPVKVQILCRCLVCACRRGSDAHHPAGACGPTLNAHNLGIEPDAPAKKRVCIRIHVHPHVFSCQSAARFPGILRIGHRQPRKPVVAMNTVSNKVILRLSWWIMRRRSRDSCLFILSAGYTRSAAQVPPGDASRVSNVTAKPSSRRTLPVTSPATPAPTTHTLPFVLLACIIEEAIACRGDSSHRAQQRP